MGNLNCITCCKVCNQFTVSDIYPSPGFVANGEFNVLRRKGYQRPVSVLQIKAAVRAYYSRLSSKVLKAMLTPIRKNFVHV